MSDDETIKKPSGLVHKAMFDRVLQERDEARVQLDTVKKERDVLERERERDRAVVCGKCRKRCEALDRDRYLRSIDAKMEGSIPPTKVKVRIVPSSEIDPAVGLRAQDYITVMVKP